MSLRTLLERNERSETGRVRRNQKIPKGMKITWHIACFMYLLIDSWNDLEKILEIAAAAYAKRYMCM